MDVESNDSGSCHSERSEEIICHTRESGYPFIDNRFPTESGITNWLILLRYPHQNDIMLLIWTQNPQGFENLEGFFHYLKPYEGLEPSSITKNLAKVWNLRKVKIIHSTSTLMYLRRSCNFIYSHINYLNGVQYEFNRAR